MFGTHACTHTSIHVCMHHNIYIYDICIITAFEINYLQVSETHNSVLNLYRGLSGVCIEHVGVNEFHGVVDVGILSGKYYVCCLKF